MQTKRPRDICMTDRLNFVCDLLKDFGSCPDQTAIITDNSSITYRELSHSILTAAVNLSHQNLSAGDRFIIMMSDGLDWVSAFLGGIYLGAIPVLLPVDSVADRCLSLIKKSQAHLLVCDEANSTDIQDTACQKFSAVLHPSTGAVPAAYLFDPQQSSLWLSSSGTGGAVPKSVVHSHQSMKLALDMLIEFFGSDTNNRLYCTTKLSFQYGLFNVLYGLKQLATVILSCKTPTAPTLCNIIQHHKITQLFSTPAVMLHLAKSRTQTGALDSVNLLVCGGEVLIEDVETQILQKYHKRIYNCCGMAEVIITIMGQNHQNHKFQTIGIPFPNVRIRIVDEDLKQVPDGTPGEILVHSPTRAQGYYDDPDATEAAFLADGWYRTNDLGVIDADGMVRYTGRKNDCFKINGRFVSPVEVENHITKYPGVEDCMVAGTARPDGQIIVVANILLADTQTSIDTGNLRKFLESRLERHKIPRIINMVLEIPKTSTSKKIRRKIVC